ncbi:hypothetical protein HYFRA_00003023 [Hymenoscyphus fraxineus]|uniref:F-box domain-containing protein n=1 Tax=Hymenoscyphus fraxineus TaxID=746836 RepID=A0A9N9KRP1_9HELO|nr:hypothetical protein HYFRA_00003023 [Hymenoscyphus fraxineus]
MEPISPRWYLERECRLTRLRIAKEDRQIALPCDLPEWDASQNKALIAAGTLKPVAPPKDQLSKLPAEILLQILKEFKETSGELIGSLCAGLTCKRLYALHWSLHGKVRPSYLRYWLSNTTVMIFYMTGLSQQGIREMTILYAFTDRLRHNNSKGKRD